VQEIAQFLDLTTWRSAYKFVKTMYANYSLEYSAYISFYRYSTTSSEFLRILLKTLIFIYYIYKLFSKLFTDWEMHVLYVQYRQ